MKVIAIGFLVFASLLWAACGVEIPTEYTGLVWGGIV